MSDELETMQSEPISNEPVQPEAPAETQPAETTAAETQPAETTAAAPAVREENGRVAAFKGDSEKAYFISNTRISDLPMHDAELLRRGITVDDEEKLKELTEEYCS